MYYVTLEQEKHCLKETLKLIKTTRKTKKASKEINETVAYCDQTISNATSYGKS